jgi:uncharacterized protein involved in outer membrane biogenesis
VLACVVLAVFALLAALDSGRFNSRLAAFASKRIERPVAFETVKTHLLTTRPNVVVTGLRIGQPAWAGPGDMVRASRIRLAFRWPLTVTEIEVDGGQANLVRFSREQNNWSQSKRGGGRSPGFFSSVRLLRISGGRFTFDDRVRGLKLNGTATYDLAKSPSRPLTVAAKGMLMEGEVVLTASGAPLTGRRRGTPYPFSASLQDGATFVEVSGASIPPGGLKGGFDLRVAARGPNLANMKYLINVGLPNSAPYRLTARLQREGRTTRATDIKAVIGRSDFTGQVISDGSKARRLVTVDLDSRTLYAEDIGTLLARRPPHTVTRSVSGAAPRPHEARVFKSKRLNLKKFMRRDYRLNIKAQRFVIDGVAPGRLVMAGSMDRGKFELKPFTIDFPSGRASGVLNIDVTGANPAFRLDGSVRRAALASLVPDLGRSIGGTTDLRFNIAGAGASFRDVAAHATGRIALDLRGGQIKKAQANVISGAVVAGAFNALANKKATTDLSCAVVRMDVGRGRVSARRILLVTDVGTAVADGGIDLASETLDMTIYGRPSGFRLFTVDAPVSVGGPMLDPKVKVRVSGAPAKSAAPPQPPKIEGDRDVYCGQQMAQP